MKKFILLLISLAFFTQAQALNCVEAMFKAIQTDMYIPGEYVLDSLYRSYSDKQAPWSKKMYYTDDLPDSTIIYSGSEYRKVIHNYTQEKSKDEEISVITIRKDGKLYKTVKYYSTADSISYDITTEYENGPEKEVGYLSLRNDTLFFKEDFYYLDSTSKNVCYLGTPESENFVKLTLDVSDNTIHLLQESTYSNTDMFLISKSQEGATIVIGIRPTVKAKKFQYFDLKGRPAKNSRSILAPRALP